MNKENFEKIEKEQAEKIISKIVEIINQGKTPDRKQIISIIDSDLEKHLIGENLEDFQIHYSKERIRKNILKNPKINKIDPNRPLGWFNFYVYFRLPFSIIINVLVVIVSLGSGMTIATLLVNLIILSFLYYGLRERALWAYKMNFVVLILEIIILPLGNEAMSIVSALNENFWVGVLLWFITSFVLGLIWLLPNWIYFKNRKYLFECTSVDIYIDNKIGNYLKDRGAMTNMIIAGIVSIIIIILAIVLTK